MKKNTLLKLALLGVTAGLLAGGNKVSAEEMSPEMKVFYEHLSPESKEKFNKLDYTHKKMAMQVSEQYCGGQLKCAAHRDEAVDEQYRNQMQGQ